MLTIMPPADTMMSIPTSVFPSISRRITAETEILPIRSASRKRTLSAENISDHHTCLRSWIFRYFTRCSWPLLSKSSRDLSAFQAHFII